MPTTRHRRNGEQRRRVDHPSPEKRRRQRDAEEAIEAMSRFRDFDAAIAELEPIEFVVKGVRYTLDEDPPCDAILKHLAAGTINDPRYTVEILESIVGAERLAEMRANGMGLAQLGMFSEWLMAQMGFGVTLAAAGEVDEGNG